jgi:hypothetical protein
MALDESLRNRNDLSAAIARLEFIATKLSFLHSGRYLVLKTCRNFLTVFFQHVF